MEHKKYNQTAFGLDIINIINETVQAWAKDYWKEDKCPPEFWVSLNNEDENNQAIMISINHLDCKFTEKLFPRNNTNFGYGSVLNQMINMYNKTM
jgi:hypothetical protein